MKPNHPKQQQALRMREIFAIARQRYLNAGGNPRKAVDEKHMTEAEEQEFKEVLGQVLDDEYINNYLQNKSQNRHS